MTNYKRVTPRDLFNEAKLLKCIGRISLFILENQIKGLNYEHTTDDNEGFTIVQDKSDGSISIWNIHFSDAQGEPVYFSTGLNALSSKD